jgi:hypothetical protein
MALTTGDFEQCRVPRVTLPPHAPRRPHFDGVHSVIGLSLTSLGVRSHSGSRQFCDRNIGRAHNAVYNAVASAAHDRPWHARQQQFCLRKPPPKSAMTRGCSRIWTRQRERAEASVGKQLAVNNS